MTFLVVKTFLPSHYRDIWLIGIPTPSKANIGSKPTAKAPKTK